MTYNGSLIGDIGGTNARFALVKEGDAEPRAIRALSCADFANLDHAIEDYLQSQGVDGVSRVCLAVASPVKGTRVKLTNSDWQFDIEEMRVRFGWRTFKVVNDFTAMALGVLHVGQKHLVAVCGGPGDPRRPILVIGPGTGLGVSGLVPTRGGWVPLMTEGGHVDFAPTNKLEFDVLRVLKASFGRVSVERLLCGEGLLNLYRARAEVLGVPAPLDSPEKITVAADRQDALARDTLNHFCELLGRTAGNAVLTLGSLGGVYLCGGMVPRFLDFFLASPFRSGFEDKGRMRPLLESTPVYVVTDPYTGLRGAAEALTNPEL
ncbi:glucokinase [Marinobacter santoriniensis NKSG1]|uniref:Glucokinase n=1 Tax=Marinobacter santoriniensis NKSG1 TaxID=1288826 RepID=M7DDI3_9GAMM|nr:glucokinase [Marinobacter santoriniensis]EMP55732.1 glucokinase [Marinobacter santoriniensis NKSG1]